MAHTHKNQGGENVDAHIAPVVIERQLRSAIVQTFEEGVETSRATTASRRTHSNGRNARPLTMGANHNQAREVRDQLPSTQEHQPLVRREIGQPSHVVQGNNPRVTPIDLNLRERLQNLEKENRLLKSALEKRPIVEGTGNTHSESVAPFRGARRSSGNQRAPQIHAIGLRESAD